MKRKLFWKDIKERRWVRTCSCAITAHCSKPGSLSLQAARARAAEWARGLRGSPERPRGLGLHPTLRGTPGRGCRGGPKG